MKRQSLYRMIAIAAVIAVIIGSVRVVNSTSRSEGSSQPVAALVEKDGDSGLRSDVAKSMEMTDVIDRARSVRQAMASSLSDYTATFIKQVRDSDGVLGDETAMEMKIQTRFRDSIIGTSDQVSPVRVFLRFTAPASQKGRKVIWGEDLYDGKMAVHETGMLLSLKTIWLDPTGMIAMQGQKYPISEIGMVKLVEKLIERGKEDIDDPDLRIELTPDHEFDGHTTELLRVRRSEPSGKVDDYSLAEIVLDQERQLILQYRSFGWAKSGDDSPPLLESYTYEDVQVNVGLTDADFDVKNPQHGYPAF